MKKLIVVVIVLLFAGCRFEDKIGEKASKKIDEKTQQLGFDQTGIRKRYVIEVENVQTSHTLIMKIDKHRTDKKNHYFYYYKDDVHTRIEITETIIRDYEIKVFIGKDLMYFGIYRHEKLETNYSNEFIVLIREQ